MRAQEFERRLGLDPYILEIAVLLEGLATHHILLNEAEMTADQVQSLFGDVEKKMASATTTAGKVFGAAGKGLQLTAQGLKTMNDYRDKLIAAAGNTKAVQGFDKKSEEYLAKIKSAIGEKFPKVVEGLEKYAEWAKKNPVKQGLIIAALVAIVSFIAAPAVGSGFTAAGYTFVGGSATGSVIAVKAGAVAGFILRLLNSLLKGEKMSTALLKGATGGIASYIAGLGVGELAEMFGDPKIENFVITTEAGKKEIVLSTFRQLTKIKIEEPDGGVTFKELFLDVAGTPEEIKRLGDTWKAMDKAFDAGDIDKANELLKSVADANWAVHKDIDYDDSVLSNLSDDGKNKVMDWFGKFIGKESMAVQQFNGAIEDSQNEFMEKVQLIAKGVNAAAQGAAAGGLAAAEKKPTAESVHLSEADVKGAIGKIGSWAAKQGKEVMQQFTEKKLMAAWNKAGKPLESRAIYKMLIQLGIPVDVVKGSFGSQNISLPTKDEPEAGAAQAADDGKDAKDTPKVDPSKFSTGNKPLDDKVREILSTKGKEAALAYLANLEKGDAAPAANGSSKKVLKASDGNTYNLSVGKSGDRIWLDAKTGSEASPAIDAELEKASGAA